MAGLIAFQGHGGSVYLMGWTGGYVLLVFAYALLMARLDRGHHADLERIAAETNPA